MACRKEDSGILALWQAAGAPPRRRKGRERQDDELRRPADRLDSEETFPPPLSSQVSVAPAYGESAGDVWSVGDSSTARLPSGD